MTAGQRLMYAYSLTIGYVVLAYLWIAFTAGGPLPARNARARITATARNHAYGDIPHA